MFPCAWGARHRRGPRQVRRGSCKLPAIRAGRCAVRPVSRRGQEKAPDARPCAAEPICVG
ncbi:MAG: hypothetical protein AVDCRST_MAG09-942 [uncultured Sphingomonas sp.]|uniref:Uncharacterized protein n=1 Tax=uncultured Sphingomonas sp. TaxID=158754 RepID=A0A6J4SJE3_9SPHN|nr:MAG: hypothetical protein AVDCRST_MAG09-942 [uncultured Sphingomonas sp.]